MRLAGYSSEAASQESPRPGENGPRAEGAFE
jgi:hypothetical protein